MISNTIHMNDACFDRIRPETVQDLIKNDIPYFVITKTGFVYRRNSKQLLRSRIKAKVDEKPKTFDPDVVQLMSKNTLGDQPNLVSPRPVQKDKPYCKEM